MERNIHIDNNSQLTVKARPKSITVIGWLFVIGAACTIFNVIDHYYNYTNNPDKYNRIMDTLSVSASFGNIILLNLFEGIVGIISGICLLRGINWGRQLYIIAWPVIIIINILLVEAGPAFTLLTILFSIVSYLIVIYFLTRPRALAFFTK